MENFKTSNVTFEEGKLNVNASGYEELKKFVEEMQKKKAVQFTINGGPILLTSYAKYLVEHLENSYDTREN